MNIVLVGNTSLRRNFVREILSRKLCPLRYVYHSFDILPKKSYWVDQTELLVICEKYENRDLASYSGNLLNILEDEEEEQISANLNDISSLVYRENESFPVGTNLGLLFSAKQSVFSQSVEFRDGKLRLIDQPEEKSNHLFDFSKYFDYRKASVLGSRIVHFPAIASTEDVFNQKSVDIWPGLVVIADQQIKGFYATN